MSNEFHYMSSMAVFYTVHTNGIPLRCVAGLTPIEIMHGEAGVAGDFVETLACGHSLLYHVVISRYYVIFLFGMDSTC